eukprot:185697-Pleurochrysis_carterae.AAC.1
MEKNGTRRPAWSILSVRGRRGQFIHCSFPSSKSFLSSQRFNWHVSVSLDCVPVRASRRCGRASGWAVLDLAAMFARDSAIRDSEDLSRAFSGSGRHRSAAARAQAQQSMSACRHEAAHGCSWLVDSRTELVCVA